MGSTYLSLHYHIIFSTKRRTPWIASRWRARLHAYLGGTIRGLDGVAEIVGGVEDHVHLLVGLRATHTLANFVRELKKAGTSWVREQKLEPQFTWQEGYAVFTVSPNAREGVRGYIANQEEHHKRRDYLSELRSVLEEVGIPFESEYLE